jgi:hypothetical protein
VAGLSTPNPFYLFWGVTSRMITYIVKNRLRDNLEMTVKEAKGLVKQKFLTIQPSYNKLWRGRELTITDIFGS